MRCCYHDGCDEGGRTEDFESLQSRIAFFGRWYSDDTRNQCFFGSIGRGEVDDDEDDVLVVTVRKRRILRGWSWNGVNYNNKITRKIVQFKSQSLAIYTTPPKPHSRVRIRTKRPADRIPCFFTRNQTRSSELLFSDIPDLKTVSVFCSLSLLTLTSDCGSSCINLGAFLFSYSWRAGFLFLLRHRDPIMFSSYE